MRLEQQHEEEEPQRTVGQYAQPTTRYGEERLGSAASAREQANRWLARFAPLVPVANEATTPRTAEECRWRIRTVRELRADSDAVRTALETHASPEDTRLLTTLESAMRVSEEVETGLRRQLARLAPGDPDGMVDLDALGENLAEVAARQEVGIGLDQTTLMLNTSLPNWGTAGLLGIFSLGWLTFTTFHAFLMIGGLMRAFGPLALFLLAFYSIFWAVGIGMAKTALDATASETVELNGNTLKIRRKGPLGTQETVYGLAPGTRAEVVQQQQVSTRRMRRAGLAGLELAMRAADGREIRFARNALPAERQEFARRINGYLKQVR